MLKALNNMWRSISYTGIRYANSEREKKEIVDLNRGLFVFLTIQCACLVSHIVNGLQRSALMTAVFVAGLLLIRFLIAQGKVNTAKISSILLINYNTLSMSIFLGPATHVIDFLL
ncbi:MAG: hypothetical protein KA149_12595, partial [Chitinophagales bacterium]|nr:hypothetical protein [Chitinophagales bacterium]